MHSYRAVLIFLGLILVLCVFLSLDQFVCHMFSSFVFVDCLEVVVFEVTFLLYSQSNFIITDYKNVFQCFVALEGIWPVKSSFSNPQDSRF